MNEKVVLGVISINRAKSELDCSAGYLYKLIREGKLTRQKFGNKTFLKIDELKNFIKDSGDGSSGEDCLRNT